MFFVILCTGRVGVVNRGMDVLVLDIREALSDFYCAAKNFIVIEKEIAVLG